MQGVGECCGVGVSAADILGYGRDDSSDIGVINITYGFLGGKEVKGEDLVVLVGEGM